MKPKSEPAHCRPEVWRYFTAQLERLAETNSLIHAAAAVAWQLDVEQEPAAVPGLLDELARGVLKNVRSQSPVALLAHLHAELFDERGFSGETRDYYSPRNSFLPEVLRKRRGLPVLLALVYKAVGERIGLEIEGLNTPGHFLTAVRDGDHWLLIDPYAGGRAMSIDEASARISEITGRPERLSWDDLPVADHPMWLARIILNLLAIYQRAANGPNAAAMEEMLRTVAENERD
ncbi:MAG: transglutaminase-like domain-containing protein [Pirellulales bacterium]